MQKIILYKTDSQYVQNYFSLLSTIFKGMLTARTEKIPALCFYL